MTHGIGALETHIAAPCAFTERQHEHETLGAGYPSLARELARPQNALAAHAERPVTAAAEVALLAVLGLVILDVSPGAASQAALDLVAATRGIGEERRTNHVPRGVDGAQPLLPAELCHVLFEVDDQVFCVRMTQMPWYFQKDHGGITRMSILA